MKKDFRDFIGLAVPKYLFDYENKSYYGMLIAMWEDGRYCMHIGLSKVFWTLEEMPDALRIPLILAKAKYPCEIPFPNINRDKYDEILELIQQAASRMPGAPVPGVLLCDGLYLITMALEEIEPFIEQFGVSDE